MLRYNFLKQSISQCNNILSFHFRLSVPVSYWDFSCMQCFFTFKYMGKLQETVFSLNQDKKNIMEPITNGRAHVMQVGALMTSVSATFGTYPLRNASYTSLPPRDKIVYQKKLTQLLSLQCVMEAGAMEWGNRLLQSVHRLIK